MDNKLPSQKPQPLGAKFHAKILICPIMGWAPPNPCMVSHHCLPRGSHNASHIPHVTDPSLLLLLPCLLLCHVHWAARRAHDVDDMIDLEGHHTRQWWSWHPDTYLIVNGLWCSSTASTYHVWHMDDIHQMDHGGLFLNYDWCFGRLARRSLTGFLWRMTWWCLHRCCCRRCCSHGTGTKVTRIIEGWILEVILNTARKHGTAALINYFVIHLHIDACSTILTLHPSQQGCTTGVHTQWFGGIITTLIQICKNHTIHTKGHALITSNI